MIKLWDELPLKACGATFDDAISIHLLELHLCELNMAEVEPKDLLQMQQTNFHDSSKKSPKIHLHMETSNCTE